MKNSAFLPAFIMVLSIAFGISCMEIVEIPINEEPQKIMIEGRIHDGPGPYQVNVRTTTEIYATGDFPAVENAMVTISDDLGTVDTLLEVAPGVYETSLIQGAIGRSYSLDVKTGDKQYSASAEMKRVNPIDTLLYVYLDTIPFLDTGYYVIAVAQEAAGLGDYYRFLFYQNDSLYDDPNDIWYTDDRLADGNLAFFQFPYDVQLGDTVRIDVWSIEKPEYDYYYSLQSQANSAGNPFGSPPDNVKGNISNGALGFFGANAIRSSSVIIQ